MRIGVDLGGTKIEAIAIAPSGAELARQRVPAPQADYGATIAAIRDLIRAIETDCGATAAHVGMGIPGAVSPRTGLVKNANSTWLIGHAIDRDLASAIGRPVRVANDANCFALSEASDGAGAGAEVVFGVILGTGVGGGWVVRGSTVIGANAVAGEWGHNPLPWPNDEERPGRACYCGFNGCIETFLNGAGLVAAYREEAGTGARLDADAPWVHRAAVDGDRHAEQAMRRYEDRLARALAHVINMLDPDVIVLGGGLSKIGSLYENVPKLWSRWVFGSEAETSLRQNKHGDSSGVRGAAWLWPENENAGNAGQT